MQEVKGEFPVVRDVEFLHVQLGEGVEGGVVLHTGEAVDLRHLPESGLPLFIEPSAGDQHGLGALVVFQRRRDHQLRQGVGTQAHGRHLEDALHVVLRLALVPAHAHPAAAEAADDVRLGQAVGGDHHEVRGQGRGGDVLHAVHHQPVVNLIGEDDKIVFPGNLNDRFQHLLGIDHAGGVVGVDDDNGAGALCHLFPDVVHVGEPLVGLVAGVEYRLSSGDISGVGPEGVAGGGHEDLVPPVAQGQKAHENQFADAVADVDVIRVNALNAPAPVVGANGLPGGGHSPEIAVGDGLVHVFYQCFADALRHSKAKGGRVAGVQAEDLDALLGHALALQIERTPNIGVDGGEVFRTIDLHTKRSFSA